MRTFSYDSLGRQLSATNPESGSVSYSYDNVGNVLTRKDSRSITTTNTYDALNRVKSTAYNDGYTPSATFSYDGAGAASTGSLTSFGNGNSTTNASSFDVMGNILASSQATGGQTYSFGYSYNLAGALTSETYPSGRVVTTGYDGANRPNAAAGSLHGVQTNYIWGVTYAPHGGMTAFALGNSVTPWFAYNARLQMTVSQATIAYNPNAYLFVEQPNWISSSNTNNGTLQKRDGVRGRPGAAIQSAYLHDQLWLRWCEPFECRVGKQQRLCAGL